MRGNAGAVALLEHPLLGTRGRACRKQWQVLQGFMHMTKAGGVREWFKGNGTNCIRIVPNSAVKFATYQELSR